MVRNQAAPRKNHGTVNGKRMELTGRQPRLTVSGDVTRRRLSTANGFPLPSAPRRRLRTTGALSRGDFPGVHVSGDVTRRRFSTADGSTPQATLSPQNKRRATGKQSPSVKKLPGKDYFTFVNLNESAGPMMPQSAVVEEVFLNENCE